MQIKLTKKTSTALLFFCICSLLVSKVKAATEKYGTLSLNERWTAEESPYIITDDILVPQNGRLVINPGVQVLVGKPITFDHGIVQRNHLDSFTISIKVYGAMKCVGRLKNRISFSAQHPESMQCQWYGIIIESLYEGEVEFAYCDMANACNALTVIQGSPIIRNCIFEFNNIGILGVNNSQPMIINSNITYNATSGVRVESSNPTILNCIIAFNRGNGIWSDHMSSIILKHSCLFGNDAGDLIGCDPELGFVKKRNKNKDSTDGSFNLFVDPIFAGSAADSLAVEQDITLKSDKSKIKDTTIAKVIQTTLTDSTTYRKITQSYKRYQLSTYSPCIDAGMRDKKFNDMDGSKNDIGIYGGPEFIDLSK